MIIIYYIQCRRSSKIVDLKKALNHAIIASQRGGYAVLENRNNLIIKNKGLTREGLEDKVTSADYLSHCVMVKTMHQLIENLNIISEESDIFCSAADELEKINDENFYKLYDENEDYVLADDLTIWIDPLDATHEFTGFNFVIEE